MMCPINNPQEALLPHLHGSCREEICAVGINQTKEPGRLVWLVETFPCGPADASPSHRPKQIWMEGGFGRAGHGWQVWGWGLQHPRLLFPSWVNHGVSLADSPVALTENKCWQLPNVAWLATTLMGNHRKNKTNQEFLDFQVSVWDLQLVQAKWGGFFFRFLGFGWVSDFFLWWSSTAFAFCFSEGAGGKGWEDWSQQSLGVIP